MHVIGADDGENNATYNIHYARGFVSTFDLKTNFTVHTANNVRLNLVLI